MILVLGLLALSFLCLTVGGACIYWIRTGDPIASAILTDSDRDSDSVTLIMTGIILIGLFLLICSAYIWSHP